MARSARSSVPRKVIGRPFQPGVSGNPGGKRKLDTFKAKLSELEPDAITALEEAARGKDRKLAVQASQVILAYLHGRPMQSQQVRVIRSLADLSEEELLAIAGDDSEEEGVDAIN